MAESATSRLFDLSGKVALVTGGGTGLGRSLAVGLAEAGAVVAVTGRSPDTLNATAELIELGGGSASAHQADVTALASIGRMVAEVVDRHGRIDILVNNAGTKVPQDVLDVTEEAWDSVVDTNLKGAFFVAQAVGRHMVARQEGRIINIASTYSVVGAPGRSTYAATKGGLLQLTRTMAAEWASKGVNVNAVGPTSIPTPMNDGLFQDAEWQRAALAKIPAGRFCQPEDVIGAVVFLAAPASSMIHGHLILVDGGLTAI